MKRDAIMLATTGLYGRGGVQAYSRRVAEIASAWAAQRGVSLHCVSLEDVTPDWTLHSSPVKYTSLDVAGAGRLRFLAQWTRNAWTAGPALTIVMHTCIAPHARVLRAMRAIGPYILVLHGIEAWRRVARAQRIAAVGAHRIVATTRYTAREFAAANGISQERFCVIPLAVPDSGYAPQPPAPAAGELNVLAVGRLSAADSYKGFDVLIDAVHRAREAGAAVNLSIVGDGDDMTRLRSRASSLGLNGSVRFAGAIPDDELQREFGRCHVFALPSRAEGFGIVYLEAMRAGRACIAGNHGGPPEIVADGEDGFLVEHGNVEQLSSRLLTLHRHPDLCRDMGRRAALTVQRKYLFPKMRDSWFQLLDATWN